MGADLVLHAAWPGESPEHLLFLLSRSCRSQVLFCTVHAALGEHQLYLLHGFMFTACEPMAPEGKMIA